MARSCARARFSCVGNTINVAGGATLDTRGLGSNGVDSTLGYAYGNTVSEVNNPSGPAVLAAANGWFNFLPFVGNGSINIDTGASLLTGGSIVLGARVLLTMGDVNFGARYLSVTQNTINVGTEASLCGRTGGRCYPRRAGSQPRCVLDRLLHPSNTAGIPALEQFTIVAGGSVNFDRRRASLDARGSPGNNVQFVVNTPGHPRRLATQPAHAAISADTFVRNGVRTGNGVGVPYGSRDPATIVPGWPGNRPRALDITAQTVLFGFIATTLAQPMARRSTASAVGFSTVNINASSQSHGQRRRHLVCRVEPRRVRKSSGWRSQHHDAAADGKTRRNT